MGRITHILTKLVSDVETEFDRIKYRLAYRLGGPDPVKIVPYRGYGTPHRFHVRGRVLEEQGIKPPTDEDSLWRNLLNMYKRLESDEVPHAELVARFQGREYPVRCDVEGHFHLTIEPEPPLDPDAGRHEVELELIGPKATSQADEPPVRATATVIVPVSTAAFGVISDIDDTVIQTDASSLLRMARTVFLNNARTRLPFAGAAAFYRALHAGRPDRGPNPIFYVSNGPWNLYDLLIDFLRLQGFPEDKVTFLRNWGISENALLPTNVREYKRRQIDHLLDVFGDLPFLLIGDSGEKDAEIYLEAVERHPDRILGIFIREVHENAHRREEIAALARAAAEAGSTLLLSPSTLDMAALAVEKGWIEAAAIGEITSEKAADEDRPSLLESLLGHAENEDHEHT